MINESLAETIDSEYNTLYQDGSPAEDSASEYSSQLESRIGELSALLACCTWGEYERLQLQTELREARLTYYELRILAA